MENPDKEEVKTNRKMLLERMQGKNPEADYTDDEVLSKQINDDYDSYDKEIGDYKGREQALANMFAADPRSAAFFMEWKDGKDPMVALVEQFGSEIKEAIDDPERMEDIAEANKKYLERVTKDKELEDEYEKNLAESLSYLEEFQAKNGLTDEQVDEAMEKVVNIVKDGIVGKFTPETIDLAMKAINHDADVAAANYEGEVKGKNTKIEEKLRKAGQGDGTAVLAGRNNGTGERRLPNLGALDRFGDGNKSIWERGGEKRKKSNL